MSDAGNPSSWAEGWVEAQQRYWDAWAALYRQGLAGAAQDPATQPRQPPPPPPRTPPSPWPWAEGLDAWWKAVASAAPPSSRDFYAKLIEQGKTFLRMSEEYVGRGFAGRAGDPAEAARGMMAFWELPLDTWRRTVSSMSVFPGDLLGSIKPQDWSGAAGQWQAQLDRFLSAPALGYTREWQEQWQELGRLWVEYQRALQAYATAFSELAADALGRWYRMIRERTEAGEDISSLRQLYDLWVDAGEAAYHDLVTTDDYARLHGALVNTLMALKLRARTMMDESAGALGMPTSQGMATVQRRQQELIRELRRLRREVEELRRARNEGSTGAEPTPSPGADVSASSRPKGTRARSRRTGRSRPARKGG